MKTFAPIALSLVLLTGGCSLWPFGHRHPVMAAAPTPIEALPVEKGCPWVLEGHYKRPVAVTTPTNPLTVTPALLRDFTRGCAIVRFTVAPDGTPGNPALRAALPLNAGPVALAVLQQMRFAPARRANRQFVIRLGMTAGAAGQVAVVTQTKWDAVPVWLW